MRKKKTPQEDTCGVTEKVQGQSTDSTCDYSTGKGQNTMSEYIEPATVPGHWVCDSDGKAKWVCEQIKKIEDNRDYMVAWYQDQIKKAKETADFERMKWEGYLAAYFDTVPHKRASKSESYSFPGGKLVLKKQDPEYKRDEPTVIAWLKEHSAPQFVKVKESLDWDNLKKSCAGDADGKMIFGEEITEDGEIVQLTIPGIDVVYREDKFVVEVK